MAERGGIRTPGTGFGEYNGLADLCCVAFTSSCLLIGRKRNFCIILCIKESQLSPTKVISPEQGDAI